MDPVIVVVLGGVFYLFALVSRRIMPWPVTMPMVLLAAGAVARWTGIVELETEIEPVVLLAEITLAVILFSDAVRIDLMALRRNAGLPARLLGIGLPLTILAGAAGVWAILGLEIWPAALVAAILAPTDAALGQAVIENRSVPQRVRQALNIESGLNDGLALPAVLLFVSLVAGEDTGLEFWIRFVLQQVGLGVLVGVAVGFGGALGMARADSAGWMDGLYAQLATGALALSAFSFALIVDANGFVAAFVAGASFRAGYRTGMPAPDGTRRAEHVVELTEDAGRGLAMLAFFVFGNVFIDANVSEVSVGVLACAAMALTIGRMLPVSVAMVGTGAARPTVAFLGWFGPRGLASMLFGLLLLEEEVAMGEELFGVITWTVVASVILHGATASAGAERYGDWYRTHGSAAMPEAGAVAHHRPRWGRVS